MGHGTVNRWELAASRRIARRREARPAGTPRLADPLPVWEAEAVFDVADPSREGGRRTERLTAELQAPTVAEAKAKADALVAEKGLKGALVFWEFRC